MHMTACVFTMGMYIHTAPRVSTLVPFIHSIWMSNATDQILIQKDYYEENYVHGGLYSCLCENSGVGKSKCFFELLL